MIFIVYDYDQQVWFIKERVNGKDYIKGRHTYKHDALLHFIDIRSLKD